MDDIDAIKQAKARYWIGVDTNDGDMVRSVLAEDCALDYHSCCADPTSGTDFLPAMNVTLNGRANWIANGLSRAGIISVHQGHHADIELTGDNAAKGVWSFTDRFFVPSGKPFSRFTGYGFYHETYEKVAGSWLIKTLRISRIWCEVS